MDSGNSLISTTINLSEAKAHLGWYVARAAAGEVITICNRNKAMAELHPARTTQQARRLKIGVLKGQFETPEDFNDPLPEFEAAYYGPFGSRGAASRRSV